jgi:hypothetical protein
MVIRIALGITGLAVLLGAVACAGNQQEAELPPPNSAAAEELLPDESAPQSSLDVEMAMDFEEEADEAAEEPRAAEPPPTQTYSPANKLDDQ